MKILRTKYLQKQAGAEMRSSSFEDAPIRCGTGSAKTAGMILRPDMLNKNSTRRKLARKDQRDLDIEIRFMEGIARRDPKFTEAWKVLSDAYSRRGKHDAGLKVDQHLARIQPDDP